MEKTDLQPEAGVDSLENLEIQPLTDDALESIAGGGSSDGRNCCSCDCCSNDSATDCDDIAHAF